MPAGLRTVPAGLGLSPARLAGVCPHAARRRTTQLVRISSSGDAALRSVDRAESFHTEVEALMAALPAEALPLEETLEQLKEQATPAPDSPLGRFWRFYNNALERHPVAVKSATSFVGFLLGDVLAQTIVGADFDVARTLRLVLFGMFMDGPVGHVWYTVLDRNVFPEDPRSNKAVVVKMLLDQLLWAPVFSCVFFTFIHLLQGHPENILPAIQSKLVPMMIANYAVWPIAHIINFKFVPPQQRILYINCCQIAWSAYLSNLSSVRLRSTHGHF
ncbi:hypothetical protein WJX81_000378 [Elliptochloris bilobata]|uniref:Uncharacterized protein n=1 Tax=Elliptochloris bilobata TaxID=381761 RepID=A0AAW1RE39_9CHLO